MFNFLKEKLKAWFKSTEEKVVEIKIKEKKQEKKAKKKEERRKRTKEELEEERGVSEEIVKDIKKEKGTEDIKPIPRQEEIEKELKEIEEAGKKPKKSFLERIGLIKKYKISEEYFSEIFENLETLLLESNVALEVVDSLKESLRKELVNVEIDKNKVEETIRKALKKSIESLFAPGFDIIKKIKSKEGVFVIVFFGINGSGKTTTIAKLANLLKKDGISSVFSASDTFRAASIEQLRKHADNLKIKLISQNYGADPAAVAYDAIEFAKAHKIKIVLIDTAGRMYTKTSLMKEMEKIIRVTKPDLKIFVAESIAGNDAIEQAKTFDEAIGIDGIILSKADVDEKGGTAISVSKVTGKPILFLGVGQEYKDLEEFNKEEIIKSLGL